MRCVNLQGTFHDCLFLVNNKFQFPIPLYRHYIHKYKLYFGNQS